MLELTQLDQSDRFPPLHKALEEPNGLLAFGGDLSVGRLLTAYQSGIFPWFNEGEPILWWSPDPRAIMELEQFHVSRSLRKFIRSTQLTVTLNKDFATVIRCCAQMPRSQVINDGEAGALLPTEAVLHSHTWITKQMQQAYTRLHAAGYAHSVEVWDQQQLVGGLYGVSFGGVFCGESMFHRVSNASKLAYHCLVTHMQQHRMDFIDCQLQNPHLQSLGCKEVSRDYFLSRLQQTKTKVVGAHVWRPQVLKGGL